MNTSRRPRYDADAFTASGGPALHTELTGIIEQIRGLYSQALDVVGTMDDASVAHLAGYPSLEAFLVTTQRVSRRHARQLVSHAAHVRETVTPTGHHQPATLPAVRAALADGVLGADHVEEIVKTVAEVPGWASGAARELVETTLVAEARTADPAYVRTAGKELVARIDQDGKPPRDEELAEPTNSFRYHRTQAGRMRFTGQCHLLKHSSRSRALWNSARHQHRLSKKDTVRRLAVKSPGRATVALGPRRQFGCLPVCLTSPDQRECP